jgi:hypothetical protein
MASCLAVVVPWRFGKPSLRKDVIDEFHQLSTRVVLLGPASDLRKCVGKLDLVKISFHAGLPASVEHDTSIQVL